LSFALVGLVAAQDIGPRFILTPANGGAKKMIRGLLDGSRFSSRQATGCDPGLSVCDVEYCCLTSEVCCTGGFCCAAGTYCDTVDGELGCCEIGQICTETSNECSSEGYSPCPNDFYCCPTGDTCFTDSTGSPSCGTGGGGGTGTITGTVTGTGIGIEVPSTSVVVPSTSKLSSTSITSPVVQTVTTAKTSTSTKTSSTGTGTSTTTGSATGLGLNSGMRTLGNIQVLTIFPIIGFAAAFLL